MIISGKKLSVKMCVWLQMFCFTIFWAQIFNGFSSQVPIDPLYLMIHNLIFTSTPPLVLGVLDQDASDQQLIDHPRLYAHGRKSQVCSIINNKAG